MIMFQGAYRDESGLCETGTLLLEDPRGNKLWTLTGERVRVTKAEHTEDVVLAWGSSTTFLTDDDRARQFRETS